MDSLNKKKKIRAIITSSSAKGTFNLESDNSRRIEEILAILKTHFPKLKYVEQKNNIAYEASQADMDYFYQTLRWKPQQKLETAIPKMITYKKSKTPSAVRYETIGVLVTSISKKVGLLKAVKNACERLGANVILVGGDINKNVIGKYFVDVFWEMPSTENLDVKKVIEYCQSNRVKLIIPTRDGELPFWASIKKRLASRGISIMVGHPDAVDICIDKLKFYKTLSSFHLPVVKTSTSINLLGTVGSYVVKERYGAGSLNIGLDLNKNQAVEHASKMQNPVFQPFIQGQEVSVDVYVDSKGKAKGVVARSRDLVVNGESQITTTMNIPKLEKLSTRIAEKLNLRGHVIVQVIIDSKGGIHIIECNSRFGGASTLSIGCGLDSFYWFMLEATNQDLKDYPFIKSYDSKKQIRFPQDIVIADYGI